ncbi:hypothetical protein POX_g08986 [Penicillium oxalicum]|uniref:hypothetical protein n=1 Tax=Penicillium oxalicum TaxID=69781 RepID=UPI0020B85D11|nr:hypothetical protein POX_g08986 [Penicillium oxalicum]KAI2786599.1 hypothetical protein POX_g08986 [Penicillium oxalicum]
MSRRGLEFSIVCECCKLVFFVTVVVIVFLDSECQCKFGPEHSYQSVTFNGPTKFPFIKPFNSVNFYGIVERTHCQCREFSIPGASFAFRCRGECGISQQSPHDWRYNSLHSHQRPLPPNNPSEQDNTSMTNPTANSATTAPTISFNSSGFSTLGSGILSISSDGFVRLPSLRRASPPGEMLGTIPRSNQSAVELSDTGFYRQRAELSAHSQRELINVPLENRRGASPLAQDFLTESNHATATATTGRSSPEGLVLNSASATDHSEVEAASLTNRETVRKIVTREGIVLGSNLEQYSPVVGSGSARTPSADGSGNRHVLSFMTFGAENSGIPGARETPRRANARSLVTGTCTGDEVASHTTAEINREGDNAMGDEAPPAYESGGVPPRQKEKSPSGTRMRWSLEQ